MPKADMVLLNGKICTVDRRFSFCEAVAIRDGWIIDVGRSADIKLHIDRHTQVIDLGGKLTLPGIQDGHTHAAFAGLYWREGFVDTYRMSTAPQVLAALKSAAEKTRPGEWIIGGGLHRTAHEGRPLDCRHLDTVTPHHPVMLFVSGLHCMLLNSKGKVCCGLDRETPAPELGNGFIERDGTGEPTGFLAEYAALSKFGHLGYLCAPAELEDCVLRSQHVLNRYGITSHNDIVGPGGDDLFCGAWGRRVFEAYTRLWQAGKLTARCAFNVLPGLNGVQSYDAIIGGLDQLRLPEFPDRNWLQASAVKIFGDTDWHRPEEAKAGRLGSCTFPGATEKEQIENYTRTVVQLHRRGWQVGVHVTGGKGIDAAIAAFIEAQRRYPGKFRRHFLIHGDELNERNVLDCAQNHIMLQGQAIAPYSFMEEVVEALSTQRSQELFDYNSYLKAGMVVAQGSDSPSMSANWLLGLQFMLTRTCKKGLTFRPDLRCGIEDGIRMYTINGAYQNHMEEISGSIEVNKLADFAVLAEDIFHLPPHEIGQTPIAMTICGGKVVYQRQ